MLKPCLHQAEQNETALTGGKCAGVDAEVGAILAYRRFVNTTWRSPSASAVLVAFHNLVTDSVSNKFQKNERNRQYCLKDIISALPQAFSDLVEGTNPMPPITSFTGVRGLGADKKLDCT